MKKRGSAKKGTKPVLVVYILDETGSMMSVKDATISGFNEYVETLERAKGSKGSKMTLISFNSDQGAKRRYSAVPIGSVKRLTARDYEPSASTPLYDAVLEGIADGDEAKNHDIVLVIQTDGEENASKRGTRDEVFRQIEQRKKSGWAVVFLGADQDAWQAAQLMGIARGATISYDNTPAGTGSAMKAAAMSTAAYMGMAHKSRSLVSPGLVSYVNTGGASLSDDLDLRKKQKRTK
jgi:Mg-chelatase subunit ChlD